MVGVFTYKDGEGVGFIGGGVFIIRTSLFTLLLARLLDRSLALNYYFTTSLYWLRKRRVESDFFSLWVFCGCSRFGIPLGTPYLERR